MSKDKDNNKDRGKVTIEEAGGKGGEAIIDKYGLEHMADIGRKRGKASHGGGRKND